MTQVSSFGSALGRSGSTKRRADAAADSIGACRRPHDFDSFRARATDLRREMTRDARLLRRACGALVVIMAVFVGLLVITAARTYAPQGETVLIRTGEPRFE